MLVMPQRAKLRKLPREVKVLRSRRVYAGTAFSVYSDMVREGPHTGQRDVVRHSGSVVVLAARDGRQGKEVLLVRQFRYAAGRYMWELPAGRVDPGESLLTGAKRELQEETGIRARKWKRLLSFYVSPGFLDETMDIFLATGLTQGKANPEEDEQISTRFFPLEKALAMVRTGKIHDAKTMTGLLWFADMHRRPSPDRRKR